jgi:hypothetical protein
VGEKHTSFMEASKNRAETANNSGKPEMPAAGGVSKNNPWKSL